MVVEKSNILKILSKAKTLYVADYNDTYGVSANMIKKLFQFGDYGKPLNLGLIVLEEFEEEYKEIEEANIVPGEDERLEQRYRLMSNSRKITGSLSESYQLTGNEGEGAGSALSRALRAIRSDSSYDSSYDSSSDSCDSYDSLSDLENEEIPIIENNIFNNNEEEDYDEEYTEIIRSRRIKKIFTISINN